LLRLVAVPLLVAGTLIALTRPASSAPAQQTTLTITTAGFVDKFGGSDPNCPGCNGVYDAEDRTEAESNPLPSLEFVVRSGGAELGRQTTANFVGVQRAQFDVPEEETYTVELVSDPAGWQLCPTEARTRTLTQADFRLGAVTVRYNFTQGCSVVNPTATSTGPTATLRPGVTPSATPRGTPATPDPGDPDGPDRDNLGGPFGQIRGVAFIDVNESGAIEAGEPGLNDVKVNLGGGGLAVHQITKSDGMFNFPGLGPTTYDVFIDPGPEWFITTPKKRQVAVNGNDVPGVDFGLIRHTDRASVKAAAAQPRTGRTLVVPPGSGIRLPATGIAALPEAPMLGLLAAALGGLAVLGYAAERRNRRP
jgi:hypothetical protein